MRILNRTAERTPRTRRNRKLKISAITLTVAAVTTAGAVSARAEDQPSAQDLLGACGSADHCQFHPKNFWKTVSSEHQVGDSAWNCSATDQSLEISWSDTKGSSNNVGVAVTAEASFFKAMTTSVQASYSHTWEISHTWGQNAVLNIPENNVGWVTRGTPEVNALGQYELHFGKPYYGHYYWYIDDYVQTGPDQGGAGQLAYRNREMTPQEAAAHCPSSSPQGVVLARETVPSGAGVASTSVNDQQSEPGPANVNASISSAN